MTIFGSKLFSFPHLYKLRQWAYRKVFDIGEKLYLEHNVIISRTHGLRGSIHIGNKVALCRNVYIDYSGKVDIRNNVIIAADSIIVSHHNDHEQLRKGNDVQIPTSIVIEEGAFIGVRSTILSSCNYIGKYAIIGAGAVVTHDVPDYTTVVGNPARIVKSHSEDIPIDRS